LDEREPMTITVVVPAYNSERTIGRCLEAIANSTEEVAEVIVVDDGSDDSTAEVAEGFGCRIVRLPRNRGPEHARQAGIKESRGDVVVFVDSDIVVKPDTIRELKRSLDVEPDVGAVVGTLSKEHPNPGFYSTYKNLYMNYILDKCPRYVDFIYGSIFAYRKDRIRLPRTFMRLGEDTELGELINREGYRILLNKDIQVVHLKKYGPASLLKNDFTIPYYWAHLFVKHRGWGRILKKRRFFHARSSQLASLPIPYLTVAALTFSPWPAMALSALYLGLNMDYFAFLRRERGWAYAAASVPVTWVDMAVMALGAAAGFAVTIAKMAARHGNLEGMDADLDEAAPRAGGGDDGVGVPLIRR